MISGRVGGTGAARCISGGGAFVWPVVQEYAFLELDPVRIDVKLPDALSLENIRISVPSVFTVAIATEESVRQNAAIRLLNLTHEHIEATARDIIIGQLRAVIATMSIDQINRDREAFLQRVQHQLEPELMKVGLTLLNVNIQDLRDESGYLEALGKQAAAQAIQKARGDVADQEKEGAIRVANAEREQSVSVASAQKDRDIGLEEASRERAVRIASIKKEQSVGEQAAGFERDVQVKEAERAKPSRRRRWFARRPCWPWRERKPRSSRKWRSAPPRRRSNGWRTKRRRVPLWRAPVASKPSDGPSSRRRPRRRRRA